MPETAITKRADERSFLSVRPQVTSQRGLAKHSRTQWTLVPRYLLQQCERIIAQFGDVFLLQRY